MDVCGVCDGSGIADGECDCDGNVEDACGICDGNSTTPQMESITYPSHAISDDDIYLHLNTGKLDITFSHLLADSSHKAVTISSSVGSGFDTTFWYAELHDGFDEAIELHIDSLTSSDILELTIDWNLISFP